ncbi:MAG TPA: aspartyl/asparaginyl beta-hydroxylase domain-containing protein [Gammaproteobacteria bacterium]|nr:aspartyl/asparaginyl beta-hydroxylase domain-containing protein [Gammaproteobacteria bacterium]
MSEPQVPSSVSDIPSLLERARSLSQAGTWAEAAHVYARVLQDVPEHPEALGFLGSMALNRGEFARSIEYFRRALRVTPADAALHKNLGLALRAVGAFDEALASFDAALANQPEFPVALLNKGALLEQMGQGGQAVPVYLEALAQADKAGLLANRDMPAGIRTLLQRASSLTREARMNWIHEVLAPVRARYPAEALARVDRCLAQHFSGTPAVSPDPMQKPTFLTFPDIPARAWFERSEFPWLETVERQFPAIRAELMEVLRGDEGFRPFVDIDKSHPGAAYWEGVNQSPSWNAFFFYRDGERFEDNCRRCPVTAAALDAMPINRVADHSPEAFFSVLKPGAHIPPHTGVVNIRLVTHLPLVIPPDCSLRVGNETRSWKEGECIVFDDTFEHEAWNRSDRTRVVLIFDIWNPYLTPPEQDAMRAVIEGLSAFRRHHGQLQEMPG